MSNQTTLTIRVNSDLKKSVQEFVNSLWMNVSTAVNLFFTDMVENQRFNISVNRNNRVDFWMIDRDELTDFEKKEIERVEQLDKEDFVSITLDNINAYDN